MTEERVMTGERVPLPPTLSVNDATEREDWNHILLWNDPANTWASRVAWMKWNDKEKQRPATHVPNPPVAASWKGNA